MDAMEAVLSRRSIRKFTDKPLDEGMVEKLLRAAMAAPSAGNQQPWHFVVVEDRGLLDRIPEVHPYSLMCREAQAAIIVCGDPSLEKYKGYWVQDCSAATQNILIAARALGLGAVWCGIHPMEDRVTGFRKLFQLPEQIIPFALIPVGWPGEEKKPSERYDATRIHHNRW